MDDMDRMDAMDVMDWGLAKDGFLWVALRRR